MRWTRGFGLVLLSLGLSGCTLSIERIDARLFDTLQFDLSGTGSVDAAKDAFSDDQLAKMQGCLGHPVKHTTDNGRDYITIEGQGLNVSSLGEFQACFMSRSSDYRLVSVAHDGGIFADHFRLTYHGIAFARASDATQPFAMPYVAPMLHVAMPGTNISVKDVSPHRAVSFTLERISDSEVTVHLTPDPAVHDAALNDIRTLCGGNDDCPALKDAKTWPGVIPVDIELSSVRYNLGAIALAVVGVLAGLGVAVLLFRKR